MLRLAAPQMTTIRDSTAAATCDEGGVIADE